MLIANCFSARHHGPDLDRAAMYRWDARGYGQGLIHVFGFHQKVASQLLFSFCERTVGHGLLAVTDADCCRGCDGLQLMTAFVFPALLEILDQLVILAVYLLFLCLAEHIVKLSFSLV